MQFSLDAGSPQEGFFLGYSVICCYENPHYYYLGQVPPAVGE